MIFDIGLENIILGLVPWAIAGIIVVMMALRPYRAKSKPKMHSGKCDKCDKPFIIWLDRSGMYCWDHYEGMMQPSSDEGSELCQDPIPGHEPQAAGVLMSNCPSCGFNDDDEWAEARAEIERLKLELIATKPLYSRRQLEAKITNMYEDAAGSAGIIGGQAKEIERLRAALKEALDFIETDGCGGNVLVQRLRPLIND